MNVTEGYQKTSNEKQFSGKHQRSKSNTEADALRFEDVNCPCSQSAAEAIAVDSHISCDRHNVIHCFILEQLGYYTGCQV